MKPHENAAFFIKKSEVLPNPGNTDISPALIFFPIEHGIDKPQKAGRVLQVKI